MEDPAVFNFDEEGVTVIIPAQTSGRQLEAIRKDLPDPAPKKSICNFTPQRLVINVGIVDSESYQNNQENPEYVDDYDPPIIIEVKCTPRDLYKPARDGKVLKLAYYDDETWVILNDVADRYQLLPPGEDGRSTGEVYISKWSGDPAMSWGT